MKLNEELLDETFLSEEGYVDAEMALDRASLAAKGLSYAIEDFDDVTEVQHQLHRYLENNVSPEVENDSWADARYGAAKIVNEMMSEAEDYVGLDDDEKDDLYKQKQEEVSTEHLLTPAMEARAQKREQKNKKKLRNAHTHVGTKHRNSKL